jgi:hypothetical protein
MGHDQFDPAGRQPLAQRIAVSHDRQSRAQVSDGAARRDAPVLRGSRRASFPRAGARLPSRNHSLHLSCWRSFSSLKNARQIFSQTPCSSQSRSRRQHVEGWGDLSGGSYQRAPLRRIQRIPSNTRRFLIHRRPPLRCRGGLGSKGAILVYCASVNNGPDRAIDLPLALLTMLITHSLFLNQHNSNYLSRVTQQLLVFSESAGNVRTRGFASSASIRALCPCSPNQRGNYGLLAGAARLAATLSITRTQSSASGGVNLRRPPVAKIPISVLDPSRGLNHQHFALDLASTI